MPNLSTFYHGVLWAAIDSHGSIIIIIIIIGKHTITMVDSQLRCLTPNEKERSVKNTVLFKIHIGHRILNNLLPPTATEVQIPHSI